MPRPTLSVIIPTHKRAAILAECLKRLEKQTIADQLEVIVVSDGHDEETANLFKKHSTFNFQHSTFIEIPKSHQGVARNRGVDAATAPYVLFIGDDIFLKPDSCKKHLATYKKINSQFSILNSQFAVLGHTTWDPSLQINRVMKWLEKSGWQFGYPKIARYAYHFIPAEIQHSFTYTSHISLPTELAKKIRFREDVRLYGWEDMEWGLRLKEAGVKLFYEPDAKAYHHHHLTLEQSLKRMEMIGRSAVEIEKMNPQLRVVPRGWKRMAHRLIALLPTMRGAHERAFLRGIQSVQK